MHDKHTHSIFIDEVMDLMQDFGLSEEEAKKIAHQWLRDRNGTNTNSYQELLDLLIPQCNHCLDRCVSGK